MRSGEPKRPVIIRDDFHAERERKRGATQQLVPSIPGTGIAGGADLAVEPGGCTEDAHSFGWTRLKASLESLSAGLRDVIGLKARIIIDEVGQFIPESDERPRQRARDGVLVSQADFSTGIAFRTQRESALRPVGEVVGGGGAVSGAELGMSE